MLYGLLILLIVGLVAVFFITRERIEIQYTNSNVQKRDTFDKIKLRQKLLLKYLQKAPKVTLKIYQSLTNVSLEQAAKDLSQFTSEGVLQEVGEEGGPAYYDLRSNYNKQEIKQIINRK